MSSSNPSINPAAILANYTPPESSLEAPSEPFTVSLKEGEDEKEDNEDTVIVTIPTSTHQTEALQPISYAPSENSAERFRTQVHYERTQYTITEPESRIAKVTNLDIAPLFSNAGVRGMVTNVSHGTFHNRPATLIVFSFVFRSGDHGFRFRNANIKITFTGTSTKTPSTKSGSKSPMTGSPSVVKFAPRKVFGLPTREGKKNSFGGEFSLEVPAGPVTVGPSISWGKEWEYETTHRFSTVGNFWSSKHGTDWDIVYWDIKENKRNNAGFPDRFNCAVVVERDCGELRTNPFLATVEVTVDTPMGSGFLSRPWSRERPVTFVEGVEMGSQPALREFEKLTEEEWRVLAPFDGEWENQFTDVALHRNSRDSRDSRESVPAPLQKALNAAEEESDDR